MMRRRLKLFGFNRIKHLVLVLLSWASLTSGATYVAPGNVSGTWTASNSPYIVKHGNVTVPNGSSLFIEAGVRIEFQGHHKFTVNGHLSAVGTETDSVIFTSPPHEGTRGWKGLRLIGADSTRLEYCRIENGNAILGSNSDSTGGGVFLSGAGTHVIFRNCKFVYNYAGSNGGALFVSGLTSVECTDCVFLDNRTPKDGGAAFVNNSSGSRFERCEFGLNHAGKEAGAIHSRNGAPTYIDCYFHHNVCFNSGGAVMASGQPSFRRCNFERNISTTSQGGGLYFYDSLTTATVDSCRIAENRTLLRDGGGAYCWEAAPRFTDCQFIDNESADDGGGIHCYRLGANPIFTRCIFSGNTAADRGGGLKISRYSRAVLVDCEIRNNHSLGTGGGGVFCRLQCEPTFTNCIIENNTSTGSGGGVGVIESNPRFTNCIIRNNETDSLGGGLSAYSGDVDMTDCVVSGNRANMNGGGISLQLSAPDIIRCRIQDNFADSLGGGLCLIEAHSPIANCLITDNEAGEQAGGLFVSLSNPVIVHCTIANNSSLLGHAFVVHESQGSILNSIIANTSLPFGNGENGLFGSGFAADTLPWTIRNSLFHRLGTPNFTGTFLSGFGDLTSTNANGTSCDGYGNLFYDPMFVNLGNESYGLDTSGTQSVALSAGALSNIGTDLENQSRPIPSASLPDLGCFESVQLGTGVGLWGPQQDTLPLGNYRVFGDIIVPLGQTWVVPAGCELEFMGPFAILVYGELNVDGKGTDSVRMFADSSFNLLNWRGIRFYGAESSLSTISLLSLYGAQSSATDSSGGAFGFFGGSAPSIVSSLIYNCSSTSSGGAIRVVGGSPTFTSCMVSDCHSGSGGAVRVDAGQQITLERCAIQGCSAEIGGALSVENGTIHGAYLDIFQNTANDGGGIHSRNGVLSFEYSHMFENTAQRNGGAIFCSNTALTCDSFTLSDNSAESGGGVYGLDCYGELAKCGFFDNSASQHGGAAYLEGGNVAISSGVVSGNTAGSSGGAFNLSDDSSRVTRSTIVQNTASNGASFYLENSVVNVSSSQVTNNSSGIYFRNSALARLEYCNLSGNGGLNFQYYGSNPDEGPAEIGLLNYANQLEQVSDVYSNLYVDPQYINFEDGDFRLTENSPCMDSGDPLLSCDPDLTFIEIGAFYRPYLTNPWQPSELSIVFEDSVTLQLAWLPSKPIRLCDPSGLLFAVERLDSNGVWQQVYLTSDSSCTLQFHGDSDRIVPLHVRAMIAP